jgi:alkyl hydroperoxide reductase subunit AhpF
MITHDLKRLQRITADLPHGTRLRLTLTGHARSDDFQAYGRQLTAASTAIDLLMDVTADPDPPWLETTSGIRFHALPESDKLDRLVDALKPPDDRDASLLPDHRALLKDMTLPATVRLFIAPGCPFCPQALTQWIALARSGNLLRLHIIDGALFPEVAQDANVQAVPTLILDDHWRWSGRIPVTDVLEQLATRDPSRLSTDALDGIIKEGQAEAVARAMIEKATLFPGIIDLLVHDKWPVRLGAMVVMETIAEADPTLAARVVPILQERYDRLDDPARGDVLYIIGETGDHQAVPFLKKITAHSTNPEIRQAACEALATLETVQRHQ